MNRKLSNNRELESMNRHIDRRRFLTQTSLGLGAMALGSLLNSGNLFAKSWKWHR